MYFWIKYAFFISVLKLISSELTLDLNGDDWTGVDTAGEIPEFSAQVPGGIYTDLMRNLIIEDIFSGYNDNEYKWVPRKNWTYYKNFEVEVNTLILQENINIVFEGVDTFSEVYLNDQKIGETSNMFVRYIFSVKDVLQEGNNRIEVRFQSPIEVGDNLAIEQNKEYVIPPECPDDAYNGECHVNLIRKMQASYSWDWGPSFPSVGIWKSVHIEAYNQTVVRYIVTDVQESSEDFWNLTISTHLATNSRDFVEGNLDINIDLSKKKKYFRKVSRYVDLKDDNNEVVDTVSIEIEKDIVETWWPNGYGTQRLFPLTVIFTDNDNTETSQKEVKLGFRKVELVQDRLDSGLTFYFKVNDVPIFMKGSNEIPINILPELGQDKATIRYLLESARDANMNTLRVWGGGVYESDYFYEVADELGIMIWQDFMFACALYPTNEQFLSNVVDEVRHQVKRLKSHPSIVIFAGNNENEGALSDDWWGVGPDKTIYKNDYVTLYHDTIESQFVQLAGEQSVFMTSSPSNGLQTIEDGYVSDQPGSSYYGDVHFYNYAFNPLTSYLYPIPRFASEYGYQSHPSIESYRTATDNITSDFLEHRQHHPGGTNEMSNLINQNLNPEEIGDDFENYVYYSQVIQAMSIKVQTERYRSRKSILTDDGRGYTMGALYWQLNDVWVGPTWSGIDYTGRWKMLHYFAKDFFAPFILTGEIDESRNLNIYAVSDLISQLNFVLHIHVYNWTSLDAIYDDYFDVTVDPLQSSLTTSFNLDYYLAEYGCGKNDCFLHLRASQRGSLLGPDNFVLPSLLSDANIVNANIEIASVREGGSENTFEIDITTDNIALFVWLDSHDIIGRFSENGFFLVEPTKTVSFTSNSDVTLEELQNQLTVRHLTSSYVSKK